MDECRCIHTAHILYFYIYTHVVITNKILHIPLPLFRTKINRILLRTHGLMPLFSNTYFLYPKRQSFLFS